MTMTGSMCRSDLISPGKPTSGVTVYIRHRSLWCYRVYQTSQPLVLPCISDIAASGVTVYIRHRSLRCHRVYQTSQSLVIPCISDITVSGATVYIRHRSLWCYRVYQTSQSPVLPCISDITVSGVTVYIRHRSPWCYRVYQTSQSLVLPCISDIAVSGVTVYIRHRSLWCYRVYQTSQSLVLPCISDIAVSGATVLLRSWSAIIARSPLVSNPNTPSRRSTFGHYYRVMFAALVEAIRATVAAAGSERSRLDRWATALRIFNQLVGCLRVFSSRSAVGLCLKVLLVMIFAVRRFSLCCVIFQIGRSASRPF